LHPRAKQTITPSESEELSVRRTEKPRVESTMASSTSTRKRRRLAEDPLAIYNGLVAAQKTLDEKKLSFTQNSKDMSALENKTTTTPNSNSTIFPALSSRPLDAIPSSERSSSLISPEVPVSVQTGYPTTLFLILVVHLLFLYQWNARRSRKQVLASYRILVQKKQFHRIWVALLSHPPLHVGRSRSSRHEYQSELAPSNPQSSIAMGDADADAHHNHMHMHNNNSSSDNIRLVYSTALEQIRTKVVPTLEPLLRGHASGLPLLLYNSHILWSCRALERNYQDDAFHYARVLLVLAFLTVAVELSASHVLLQSPVMSRAPQFQSIQPDQTADAIHRIRKQLLHRTMGTLTVVSTAVLLIFRSEFMYVPLQILPWTRVCITSRLT
jgi:hypothetical protein